MAIDRQTGGKKTAGAHNNANNIGNVNLDMCHKSPPPPLLPRPIGHATCCCTLRAWNATAGVINSRLPIADCHVDIRIHVDGSYWKPLKGLNTDMGSICCNFSIRCDSTVCFCNNVTHLTNCQFITYLHSK